MPEQCPVDHESRAKWLQAAQAEQKPTPVSPTDAIRLLHRHGATKYSLDTGKWEIDTSRVVVRPSPSHLNAEREISTIPRAAGDPSTQNSAERAAIPPNREQDTGHDRDSGNWVYPSQEMFFNAMKRKGHDPQAADMATIVPIHNAVNERAWREIQAWEAGRGSEACGGPKLVSFSGDSSKLSPRARWNVLVGYQKPFDRHDWVVDRCGKRVDYIIDFYSGKNDGQPGGNLSFYLDVRPKLNSWEGVKMRMFG
ncbi:cytochrome c/c1 heme-lyase [Neohortaea acidophila]|uniref:Holocytochrome c-type synthase n=1 Tax=Neohortaea acidophila TaxID=245834 RepID=A0A6A6PIS2_9PEZI|nr:cytochrome c/c1 heme-lyase [Neohortaea acidophila]KAF2479815.1 cytochrome c/c1 heme-lyase [Neohortaea acidophila]